MRPFSLFAIFLIVLLFCPGFFASPAKGASQDAKLDEVRLSANPKVIGIGGKVTLQAAVYFYGGCCYHLWAYDVSVNISIPEDMELIDGPVPEGYAVVDAFPGGEPEIRVFRWTVRSMIPGTYVVNVTVNTRNCGSMNGSCELKVVQGCAISEPVEYLSSSGDTLISVSAESFIEGTVVDHLELYYLVVDGLPEDGDIDAVADNGTVLLDGSIDPGGELPLDPVGHIDGSWRGSIPDQGRDGGVLYWLVATDNHGKMTTSPVYSYEVEDEERTYSVTNWTFIILAVTALLGNVLLIGLYVRREASRRGWGRDGFLVLGMTRVPGVLSDLEGTNVPESRMRKLRNIRLFIGIALAAIAIAMVVWAIMSGRFEELVTHIEEGK